MMDELEISESYSNIQFVQGDLHCSSSHTITNAVNCVGVMGKGIAATFKSKYPLMFVDYQENCRTGALSLGRPYLFKHSPSRWILNFPTKHHWRSKSKIEDISVGLEYLAGNIPHWGIQSLALPALGCGLGGLVWTDVKKEMIKHLAKVQIPIEIYEPTNTSSKTR